MATRANSSKLNLSLSPRTWLEKKERAIFRVKKEEELDREKELGSWERALALARRWPRPCRRRWLDDR